MRDLLARYRSLREDHLRYLVKCGVIRPVLRTNADTFFAFPDLAAIKQANEGLERGRVVPQRRADADRVAPGPARVRLPARRGAGQDRHAAAAGGRAGAEAAERRRGRGARRPRSPRSTSARARRSTMATRRRSRRRRRAYRKALEHDPYLVAALINLANIHYSRDELAEAQALYERAIGLEPDFFEAHFNLGNIYHDLGRFTEAQALLRRSAAAEPVLRRRALLPGGHVREDGPVAGGAAALARVPAARAAGRVGRAGEGVLRVATDRRPEKSKNHRGTENLNHRVRRARTCNPERLTGHRWNGSSDVMGSAGAARSPTGNSGRPQPISFTFRSKKFELTNASPPVSSPKLLAPSYWRPVRPKGSSTGTR